MMFFLGLCWIVDISWIYVLLNDLLIFFDFFLINYCTLIIFVAPRNSAIWSITNLMSWLRKDPCLLREEDIDKWVFFWEISSMRLSYNFPYINFYAIAFEALKFCLFQWKKKSLMLEVFDPLDKILLLSKGLFF